ncbi:cell envelope integrity protein CreD [Terrarubrum flagellatum]|uniref:cell envelope integrity protein CreD n=1 Tax=Terrirubrum flagellatum TaxID=2895980 RepID=UPI003144F2BA
MIMIETATPGRLMRSPGVKFFALGFLAVLILIPLLFVEQLQRERSTRAGEAIREVMQSWGADQTVAGPYLVLPYLAEGAGGSAPQRRVAAFLPEQLKVAGRADAQTLRRSIFDVAVYRGKLDLKAHFKPLSIKDVDAQALQPLWEEATLVLQISDVRGIKNRAVAKIGGDEIAFLPTIGPVTPPPAPVGVHAPLRSIDVSKGFDVDVALDLNGSRALSISPLGGQSDIALQSNWRHPSFSGAQLPDDRNVSDEGFSAAWRIGLLSRSLNQAFQLRPGAMSESAFAVNAVSVRFYQPVDIYQMAARATKYGVLFVGAVFLVVFALEMLSQSHLHVAQYAMVGLALALFYVLLLSYAEHIGFTRAYLVSAGATVALVSGYVGLCLQSLWRGVVLAAALGVAYGLVFLLLRSEDYALLAGATAGFVGLALLMLATLRIDWSGAAIRGEAALQEPQPS